jgi:hypothetical protein
MTEKTEAYAYSFKSDLAFAAIVARFREIEPWHWIDRDNDNWGAYYSARVLNPPDWGIVKLIADSDHDHFVVNVVLRSEAHPLGSRFEDVHYTLFERLLPAIGARDIVETDLYE